MFSSFFAKDPLKDFQYDITLSTNILASGDVNGGSSSHWSLHAARKRTAKVDADEYSAFVFLTQDKSPAQVQLAKQTFRRFKTLRHPNLLAYIDGVETEKALYVVTTRVVPLSAYLEKNADKCNLSFLTSWGVFQVCKAIGFLNNDCKLAHNNLNMLSIFVTRKGEWKVGAFDFCVPLDGSANLQDIDSLRFPHLDRYTPSDMAKKSSGRSRPDDVSTQLVACDSFGLATIIYEIFNPSVSVPLREAFASPEKRRARIPPQIQHFEELCTADYRTRLPVDVFAERNSRPDGYFSNFFVSGLLFIDEMALKSADEISRFLSRLDAHLDSFPSDVRENKILAQLLETFNLYASKPVSNVPSNNTSGDPSAGGAGANASMQFNSSSEAQTVQNALLTPIIKIGRSLSVEAFQKQVTPCLIRLFASPDRQTRVKLLESIPSFVEFLSPSVVNDQLFGHVLQGFSDAHALVRDATIKGCCILKDKLNSRNLEELTKQLGRVQARDPEGGVRTNAIVCLAKLTGNVAPKTRQSLVLAAFLRATKDQFGPARLSAVGALQQTNVFYPLRDLALKVLPCCTPLLVDPMKQVRDASFRLVRTCIDKLEKVSESPEVAEQLERDLNTMQTGDSSQPSAGSSADSSAGWSSWALTTISSKFYKVNDKKPFASANASADSSENASTPVHQKQEESAKLDSSAENRSKLQSSAKSKADDGWSDTTAWGGSDWGSMQDALPDQSDADADLESYEDFDATPKAKSQSLSRSKTNGNDRKSPDNGASTNATASQKANKTSQDRSDKSNAWEAEDNDWQDSDWDDRKNRRSAFDQKDSHGGSSSKLNLEGSKKDSSASKPVSSSDASSWQQATASKQNDDWNSDAFFETTSKPKPAASSSGQRTSTSILKSDATKKPLSSQRAPQTQSKAKKTDNDDDGWSNW